MVIGLTDSTLPAPIAVTSAIFLPFKEIKIKRASPKVSDANPAEIKNTVPGTISLVN